MKTKRYLSATTVALLVAARTVTSIPAEAAVSDASPEAGSYLEAMADGSPEELQRFLMEFPESDRVGTVFGELVAQLGVPLTTGSTDDDRCDDLQTVLSEEEWLRLGCGVPQQTGSIIGVPLTTGTIDDVC